MLDMSRRSGNPTTVRVPGVLALLKQNLAIVHEVDMRSRDERKAMSTHQGTVAPLATSARAVPYRPLMQIRAAADRIRGVAAEADHPVVVGISGYCGAGKSTLARELTDLVPGAVRMRGDDFLDPVRSHQRSNDWDGVERVRLVSTVLEPFRAARRGTFQRYDWARKQLGAPEPIPQARILIVDVIGLFHPEALPALDLRVWCEADLEVASAQGKERDRQLGRSHDRLWTDVWIPNDRDFAAQFTPRAQAHLLYDRAVE